MTTEPWGHPPEVIARMTDFQILNVLMRQAEKVKAATREANPDTPAAPRGLPAREDAIHVMTTHLGMTRERAEAAYDRAANG